MTAEAQGRGSRPALAVGQGSCTIGDAKVTTSAFAHQNGVSATRRPRGAAPRPVAIEQPRRRGPYPSGPKPSRFKDGSQRSTAPRRRRGAEQVTAIWAGQSPMTTLTERALVMCTTFRGQDDNGLMADHRLRSLPLAFVHPIIFEPR